MLEPIGAGYARMLLASVQWTFRSCDCERVSGLRIVVARDRLCPTVNLRPDWLSRNDFHARFAEGAMTAQSAERFVPMGGAG